MLTVKRLYIYGVMGVALVPLLVGLTDLARLLLEALTELAGVQTSSGSRLAREDLSRALALVATAAPIWAVHLWLLRRSFRGPEANVEDERASAARATYFFLVLVVTFAAVLSNATAVLDLVLAEALLGAYDGEGLGAIASLFVVGTAWVTHLWWRGTDLRRSPQRTAGDWLTRLYLYGVLFATTMMALFALSTVITQTMLEIVAVRPAWGSASAWQENISAALSVGVVAVAGWLVHWSLSGRLLRAPEPMGTSHRGSRTRTGYFLGVVLVSAIVVLSLAALCVTLVLTAFTGLARDDADGRLFEAVAGPLSLIAVFLAAWWWHRRRASVEASMFGGEVRLRSVIRATRLVVAIVGLAGVAVGFVWGLQLLLDTIGTPTTRDLIPRSTLTVAIPALATALVGLVMWLPAWLRSQQERNRTGVEAATATARRTYLLLVSGVAVLAVMGSLGWLIFEAIRQLLGIGPINDTSWPISVLAVASVGLAYHLLELRSDQRLAATATAGEPASVTVEAPPASGATEILEVSGPVGADFAQLNEAIRSSLPDGFVLREIPSTER